MGLFDGPVSNRDRVRWQMRAVAALAEMLAEAYAPERDLPVIPWQIGVTGGFAGTVAVIPGEDREAVFFAWAGFLDLAPVRHRELGVVRLYASAKDWRGKGVDIALSATVVDPEPDESGVDGEPS